MKNFQTSCEVPNPLLEYNLSLNDFDFVLYHLYRSNPTYKNYYNRIRKFRHMRECILDNSAYEFSINGQEFDLDEFILSISELKPDKIIAPDSLGDLQKTIEDLQEFFELCVLRDPLEIKGSSGGQNYKDHIMPVAQGNSSGQLIESLYEYAYQGYPNVCIPFHNPAFLEDPLDTDSLDFFYYTSSSWDSDRYSNGKKTKKGRLDDKYALGRVKFIKDNIEFLIDHFDRIHLLGSHNPIEKKILRRSIGPRLPAPTELTDPLLITMDTGYPVKCGIAGLVLGSETEKPDLILDDFIGAELDSKTKNLIIQNIYKFRTY